MGVSFDHSLIKGMLASAGLLMVKYTTRYPSVIIIFEALRRLEVSFGIEEEIDKSLTEWRRKGYQLTWFHRLLSSRKAEDLRSEFDQLKKDVAIAESLRSRFYSKPFAERARLERIIFERPSEARRMSAVSQRPVLRASSAPPVFVGTNGMAAMPPSDLYTRKEVQYAQVR